MVQKSVRSLIPFLVSVIVTSAAIIGFLSGHSVPSKSPNVPVSPTPAVVLGATSQAPAIYIYGNNGASGGVIGQSGTDEPTITLSGYQLSGEAQIDVYQSDIDAVLAYLIHDSDGKQVQSAPDSGSIHFQTTFKKDVSTNNYGESKILLPIEGTGVWYLKIHVAGTDTSAFVVRSNIAVLAKEGNNQIIYWGEDLKTKRSVSGGLVIPYSLLKTRRELERSDFNSEGIATSAISQDADIALIAQGDDRAIIPLNLKYLNEGYNYSAYRPKGQVVHYFVFTDSPLYKPGDKVNFKAILRDDDDARYSIPGGTATAQIYNGYYYSGSNTKPVFEKNYPISSDGTISGQYQLPDDAKVGFYSLNLSVPGQTNDVYYWGGYYSPSSINFDVEYYRKPDYSIDVTVPSTEVIAGDGLSFKINGNYFSGQPLANQTVKYTVYSGDFYEYTYLMDREAWGSTLNDNYRYGQWYGAQKVVESQVNLDQNGQAIVPLDTKLGFAAGKSQIFSIEATIVDNTQNPSFSRKNVIVHAGEYSIYRKDYLYSSLINTPVNLPLSVEAYNNSTSVANLSLKAKIHRDSWIEYQDQNSKYPQYRQEQEDLPAVTTTTKADGSANLSFTPTKIGSYKITVEGQDARGNLIAKEFYMYVSQENYPYYSQSGQEYLTLSADKQKYASGDTAHLNIHSIVPDRDVFLTLERGRVDRYQIVHLQGNSGTADVAVVDNDMPNTYANVSSFDDRSLDSNQINLSVSTDSRRIKVVLTPDAQVYGPGETVHLDVATTDVVGNPLSADVAVWTADKAIFELSDSKLGDIFNAFWSERGDSTSMSHSLQGISTLQAGGGGGCFVGGTQILMADGSHKDIAQVQVGDFVQTRTSEQNPHLVSARVDGVQQAEDPGYIIINQKLRVTADHLLRVNDSWKEAGSTQIGDNLESPNGQKIPVISVEWQQGITPVYNLAISKYHTYFADGVWVHNQKGIDRNVFKDLAYWNPSVHTDNSGHAQISFVLPDNLTTWLIAGVADTTDTRVGQTTAEIKTSKDVVVRPVVPNILRAGDTIKISALVHNFTTVDHTFNLGLAFDSGTVEEAQKPSQLVKAGSATQVYWLVKPETENAKAKFIFSAEAVDANKLADKVEQVVPVVPFVYEEQRAEAGIGNKDFTLKLSKDAHPSKTKVTLALAPSLLTSLPSAMKYLIQYPYGCVEQTTSRFVPAVIAKANASLFAPILADRNIDDIIKKGISKLASQQQSDGGWTWWFQGNSDPFITAYVVEYLLQAEDSGATVDQSVLDQAQSYLQRPVTKPEDIVAQNYGLTVLGDTSKTKIITDISSLSPDLLAMAVISNYRNGNTNPETNGLSRLMSLSRTSGEDIYWEAGNKLNFGSRDASTAWAIRAILVARGDRDLAAKGAMYLMHNRKYDYWSNTYATAQVIRALTELGNSGNELNPSYTYKVSLDGQVVKQGSVNSTLAIPDLIIPNAKIKTNGSQLRVEMSGSGQLYSTLAVDEFRTDTHIAPLSHGITVKREIVNAKGSEYSLGVGDTAVVTISLSGLQSGENYGLVKDELPSGLIPINQSFNNEQGGDNPYYYNWFSDNEITQNGMVLSLRYINSDNPVYTYKARVVNAGTFIIPPASAVLMYAPDTYGRTGAETLTIGDHSSYTPLARVTPTAFNPVLIWLTRLGLGVLVVAIIAIIVRKRRAKISPPAP